MRFIRGFDEDILAALNSPDPHIRYNAVCAAGNWGLDEAWPHITRLLESPDTDKYELIAAIEASIEIRPKEAGMFLLDLTDHDDGDVVDAAHENMAMAEAMAEAEEHDALDEEDIDSLF
jgi:HEAT repeat protein